MNQYENEQSFLLSKNPRPRTVIQRLIDRYFCLSCCYPYPNESLASINNCTICKMIKTNKCKFCDISIKETWKTVMCLNCKTLHIPLIKKWISKMHVEDLILWNYYLAEEIQRHMEISYLMEDEWIPSQMIQINKWIKLQNIITKTLIILQPKIYPQPYDTNAINLLKF